MNIFGSRRRFAGIKVAAAPMQHVASDSGPDPETARQLAIGQAAWMEFAVLAAVGSALRVAGGGPAVAPEVILAEIEFDTQHIDDMVRTAIHNSEQQVSDNDLQFMTLVIRTMAAMEVRKRFKIDA